MDENPIRFDVYKPCGTAHLILKPGEDQYKVTFSGGEAMTCEVEIRGETPVAAPTVFESEDAYLNQHGVLPFLRAMVAAMSKEKPTDPFEYMARQMTSGYGVVKETRAPTSKTTPAVVHATGDAVSSPDATMKQFVTAVTSEAVGMTNMDFSADEAEIAGEVDANQANITTAVTPTAELSGVKQG